jgi:hypothetical protein
MSLPRWLFISPQLFFRFKKSPRKGPLTSILLSLGALSGVSHTMPGYDISEGRTVMVPFRPVVRFLRLYPAGNPTYTEMVLWHHSFPVFQAAVC